MSGPDFTYFVPSAGVDTSNLVTATLSPTPVNNDILVVKLTTWDTGAPMGAVTGGGQTYNIRNTAAPGGFNCWTRILYATISGTPSAFAVTGGGTSVNSRHCMTVEHYLAANGYSVAATPATNSTISGSGAPQAAIVTTGNNSVLTWCSADDASLDPATAAYRLSATNDGLGDFHVGANTVQYFAYATVGAAGSYDIGMTAPTPQTWVMTGMEVLVAGAASTSPPTVIVAPSAAAIRASTW
jgi:hypothetical protein